ncbi:PQQ-binding-like beta-propeller repeat protein [Streptomyces diastatochromogenes]|uniref:outer membrane protein assembly factor BamB family protein n=1 Tax=Streptomyces diastatochromogenes TaxID=42236 RepID=UPI0022BBDE59|nr:PQQ-binding-like beta-propeller repeat protein [Streptomyces diastatochromogenes]MCZ0986888.1 PQQ-binding-like beta-propeller repeat protein [Streptomyces diastatochromogenes]
MAAGAAVGLAVEFHALGWTSIPGGECGGDAAPCPEGTTPTIILAFVLTFVGLGLLVRAIQSFTERRPGKVLPAVLAVAGVLLALWPGWQAFLWMRGPVLDAAWQVGRDRPATVRAQGVWTVGRDASTVVRVRDDALVSYDSHDGDRRWTLRAPVRESVCGMSERVVDGVGLVAFARYKKPCDTVWGVDTRTGRKLWERHIKGVARFTAGSDSLLAADGDVALVLTDTGVQAYGLADGRPRWSADLRRKHRDGEGCAPNVVSATGGTTTVVVTCETADGGSGQLVTLDNATGKRRGSQDLPIESPADTVMVLSADPFTLLLKESDKRGVAAVLAYPDHGDPVRIPLTGDDEDLTPLPDTYDTFTARPALWAGIRQDTLVVATTKPGASSPDRVSGYALRDGRHLWHADLDGVAALAPAGPDRVAVLGNGRLRTLDTADGHRVGEADGTTVRTGSYGTGGQLLRAGDTWVVVNGDGTDDPPLLGLR